MAPKCGNLDMLKRNHKLLPLSEKVKVLNLIRKEKKLYAEVAKICGQNESSIREIVKEKEIRAILLSNCKTNLKLQKLWPRCR